MRIQLWSYNYDPEPTGIAPLSTAWASAMSQRGHEVEVVAAHPHYPEPRWGRRALPYREIRDDIAVTRLPLLIGRQTSAQRIRQELSFTVAQTLAIPALRRPDVLVAMSPSFPALMPAMMASGMRRVPWVLWLQDLLPDGATATGVIGDGVLLRAARWLERKAYRSAAHILVISESFKDNLVAKGVPEDRITRIYNWSTWPPVEQPHQPPRDKPPRVLCMGNIGYSQGLSGIVRAFEADVRLRELQARLVIAGTGVAAAEVRATIATDRVEMTGLLFEAELADELRQASIAGVTQNYEGTEFNVPSKLMNYLAWGLPVAASVNAQSETARLLERSGAGQVTDASRPSDFASCVADMLTSPAEMQRRGALGLEFARRELTPAHAAEQAETVLSRVMAEADRQSPRE